MTDYLTRPDVEALHIAIMERTGDHPYPLGTPGKLESALMRAQNAAYYEKADLVRQAALLVVGVAQAQAYLEGNKRTAYIAMDVFLRLNDRQYGGDPLDLARELEAIAAPDFPRHDAEAHMEALLRRTVLPL